MPKIRILTTTYKLTEATILLIKPSKPSPKLVCEVSAKPVSSDSLNRMQNLRETKKKFRIGFVQRNPPAAVLMRWLQLRFDFDSTGVRQAFRLRVKGH